MRRLLAPSLVPVLVLSLGALAACGNDGDSTSATTTQPSDAASPTGSDRPATPTTEATPPDLASLFDAPETLVQAVDQYCTSWPDVAALLAEEPVFVDVPDDGWRSDRDAPPSGPQAFASAVTDTGWAGVDCGTPSVVTADWVAVPAAPARADGSGEQGIWVLRVTDGGVHWHLAYGTSADAVGPVSTAPDPQIVAEAEAFCDLFEDTDQRSSVTVLPAMSDEPAVHNIPNGNHYEGTSGIRELIVYFPSSDQYRCGDATTSNGEWSAQGTTVFNPSFGIFVAGVQVQLHTDDGRIDRQYAHFTQTQGPGNWGLPLDPA